MMQREAWIEGPRRQYRYTLTRQWWDCDKPRMMAWIMLNPSTADANIDDRTIKKCIATGVRLGYQGIIVANLFAYRSTNPDNLDLAGDAVGPHNDKAILQVAGQAEIRVVAWGVPLSKFIADRAEAVKELLADFPLHVVGLTKDGHPRHPVRMANPLEPILWKAK